MHRAGASRMVEAQGNILAASMELQIWRKSTQANCIETASLVQTRPADNDKRIRLVMSPCRQTRRSSQNSNPVGDATLFRQVEPLGEVVMRGPFAPGVGGVLSADIAVPEHERELSFYSRILTTGSAPLWRDDLRNNRGTPVIGLGARSREHEALPLQWMPHFQVLDVGASVVRALGLGGTELMHAKSEGGQSQWAVLVDPMGAAFGVVPVISEESEAADQPESIGRISWLTLVVSDVSSACEFYEQVVGWSTASADADGGVEMRRPDGVSVAAICHAGGDNQGIPPVWILSLPVDDFEESLRLVRAGGGEIIQGSTDAGHAVVRDPVGVCIALQAKK